MQFVEYTIFFIHSGQPGLSADKNITNNSGIALSAEWDGDVRWQRGFDARILSHEQTIQNALRYVQCNAFKHNLVESPDDWPWTSLHYPDLIDSLEW